MDNEFNLSFSARTGFQTVQITQITIACACVNHPRTPN